ncbi:MAG: hypothetical protein R3B90_19465 [Planctomycetaceae bacterium]
MLLNQSPALPCDFRQLPAAALEPLVIGTSDALADRLLADFCASANVNSVNKVAVSLARGDDDALQQQLDRELPTSLAIGVRTWRDADCVLLAPAEVERLGAATQPVDLWLAAVDVVATDPTALRVLMPDFATPTDDLPRDRIERLPALGPTVAPRNARGSQEALQRLARAATRSATSRPDALAVEAGLLLMHDWLHESHATSQQVEHAGRHCSADYWHAIMHRREPDYSNAKYWFRNVGVHPIFPELARTAERLFAAASTPAASDWLSRLVKNGDWQPFAFVDLCQATARDAGALLALLARQVQWAEMRLLLRQSWQDATATT